MKRVVRTFHFVPLLAGVCLSWFLMETSRADDKTATPPSSAPAAPDLDTYTPSTTSTPADPNLDPSVISGSNQAPDMAHPKADPDQQKAEAKEQNWLFNNIADQQKADRDRARAAQGLPPEKDTDKDKDKSDPAALLLYPAVSLTPPKPAALAKDAKDEKDGKTTTTDTAKNNTADPHAAKDGTPNLPLAKESIGTVSANSIAKPNGDSMNQFQPMIKGLSVDTSKPLADSTLPLDDAAKKINASTAPSGLDAKITPINPDLVRPIDFSSGPNGQTGSNGSDSASANASGPIVIAPGGAPDDTKVPSFDISSATTAPAFNSSYNTAITAPSAPSMPLPPSVAAITPIDNPAAPALPNPTPAPSYHPAPAYQLVPTGGPSKPKVNDPLDMTFVH